MLALVAARAVRRAVSGLGAATAAAEEEAAAEEPAAEKPVGSCEKAAAESSSAQSFKKASVLDAIAPPPERQLRTGWRLSHTEAKTKNRSVSAVLTSTSKQLLRKR